MDYFFFLQDARIQIYRVPEQMCKIKSTTYKAKVTQYSSANGYNPNRLATGNEISSLESVVYFEYDSAIVSNEYDELLLRVSAHLINNPQIKIVLEGHTDERGTREYNLALGEERANSVLKQLNILGVPRQQMSSLSFGKKILQPLV